MLNNLNFMLNKFHVTFFDINYQLKYQNCANKCFNVNFNGVVYLLSSVTTVLILKLLILYKKIKVNFQFNIYINYLFNKNFYKICLKLV